MRPRSRFFCPVAVGIIALAYFAVPNVEAQPAAPALSLMDAVEMLLRRDPTLELERSRLESARGSVTIAAGRFDPGLSVETTAVDAVSPTGENTEVESRSTSEQVVWTQTLRSGQVLQPAVVLDQVDGSPSVSTATVSFTVRQPLLQGRKGEAVTADERAAERELEAARLDLVHTVSGRLVSLSSNYWFARAALLDLEILRETEGRSRELLENTRRLVEADLTPAADLIQLEADLVFRETSTLAAERTLSRAMQRLGADIGLGPEEIEGLALPSDPFPTVAPELFPGGPAEYLAAAREQRADLAASRERLRAGELRLVGAEDDLKPRLDLLLTPSYTGLVEGDGLDDAFAALTDNVPGLSASLTLSYSWPIGNRVAEGVYVQVEQGLRQQSLALERQEIQVGADVLSSLDEARSNALRLQKLERAVSLFTRTLANEEKKLRAGSSTLIDVLNQRDRLTSAQQRLVAVRQALAQALVNLRFDTGTLVYEQGEGVREVRLEDLTTLPPKGP